MTTSCIYIYSQGSRGCGGGGIPGGGRAGGWGLGAGGRVLPVLALDDPILNVLSTLQIASGRAELFG